MFRTEGRVIDKCFRDAFQSKESFFTSKAMLTIIEEFGMQPDPFEAFQQARRAGGNDELLPSVEERQHEALQIVRQVL